MRSASRRWRLKATRFSMFAFGEESATRACFHPRNWSPDLPRSGLIIAVHQSLKDLPTNLPGRFDLAVSPERNRSADALCSTPSIRTDPGNSCPRGSVVGSSSLRRLAQLVTTFPILCSKDVAWQCHHPAEKLECRPDDLPDPGRGGPGTPRLTARIHERIDPPFLACRWPGAPLYRSAAMVDEPA